jgi:osmotically-inducible protein OsmY
MKASSILVAGVLIGACSSSSSERPSSLDERQEHVQSTRADAHDYSRSSGVPGASGGSLGAISHESTPADRDGNNVPDDYEENPVVGAEPLTPIDQSNMSNDIEITQEIRKKVIDNEELSFNAKNVKIITVSGKVTLRGPVETPAEKTAIESSARATAGVAKVDNQLEVKR